MNFRLAVCCLLLVLGADHLASAQQGPRRGRHHFNSQGRAYYRGPLWLTAGVGAALYSGDLSSGLGDNFPGPSVSLGLLYRLRPHLLIGGEGRYCRLGAKDQLPSRGLAFVGDNGVGTVCLRYNILNDESVFAASNASAPPVQFFVQAGLGLVLYNPKAYYGTERPTSSTNFLAPERNDYPALGGVAPVGAGLTIRLSDQLNGTLSGNYFFTTTDQLDDVSLRGNPAQNDGFGTVELRLEYSIF